MNFSNIPSFFPTPREIGEKMLEHLDIDNLKKMKILEPSAGKGDLIFSILRKLKYLEERMNYNLNKKDEYILDYYIDNYLNKNIYCIEKNQVLINQLQKNQLKVIGYDFLNYTPHINYDLILMNPPFEQEEDHLIKAIEIREQCGSEIVSLCSASILFNNQDKYKVIRNYIKQNNGTLEELGNCFINAERTTNINVCLIKIPKKDVIKEKINFSNIGNERFIDIENELNQIKNTKESLELNHYDLAESLESRYEMLKKLVFPFLKMMEELNSKSDPFFCGNVARTLANIYSKADNNNDVVNVYFDHLNNIGWNSILRDINFSDMLTSSMERQWNDFKLTQKSITFSAENIKNFLNNLRQNQFGFIKEIILEAFDDLTKFHYENKIYKEGWKTNQPFLVNSKLIIPNAFSYSYSEYSFNKEKIFKDIEKALCFLINKKYSEIEKESIVTVLNDKTPNTADSYFWEIKKFKKGTMHLKFKDLDLLKKFNDFVLKNKNWLQGAFFDKNSYDRIKKEIGKLNLKYFDSTTTINFTDLYTVMVKHEYSKDRIVILVNNKKIKVFDCNFDTFDIDILREVCLNLLENFKNEYENNKDELNKLTIIE